MSTITATPAPSIGRKPVVIGLVALGVVTVGVVTVPRLHIGTTATPAPVAAPSPATADFLDRHDAMAAAQQARSATPAHLTELNGLASAYGVAATSVGREQIGQFHRTYTWTPAMTRPSALGATLAQEQVGGLHETYAYNGRGLEKITPVQVYDGRALRLTWSDNYVPPVDNPTWTPFIRAHFYGGTVPERIVTRGD